MSKRPELIVRSPHSVQPWRAKLMRLGPCWLNIEYERDYIDADHCGVLPIEPGKGWATTMLVVRKAIVRYADGRAVE